MTVFGSYARYYDLLYRDKDYSAESQFVSRSIRKHAPRAKTLLELGSGTGMHACLLAQNSFKVHGIDRSEKMLDAAHARRRSLSNELQESVTFSAGDVRKFDLHQTYDAVISLFHVVSYQVTNDDLLSMFQSVASHLSQGGIFLFDYWFGPAVLTDRPTVRIKRLASDAVDVTRIAEPGLNARDSYVDVNYSVFVHDRTSGVTEQLRESHRMRYLFLGEIDLLARACGLEVVESGEWLTGKEPDAGTWSVYSILRK